jgi:hypothetical protein
MEKSEKEARELCEKIGFDFQVLERLRMERGHMHPELQRIMISIEKKLDRLARFLMVKSNVPEGEFPDQLKTVHRHIRDVLELNEKTALQAYEAEYSSSE